LWPIFWKSDKGFAMSAAGGEVGGSIAGCILYVQLAVKDVVVR
jgi:hypothetical protein